MPFRVIELLLEVALEAMRGQTPEQKKVMWDWYIEDVSRWRKLLKLDAE
jgi:hypothetical protein